LVEAFQQAMAAGRHGAARSLLRGKLLQPMLDAGRYHQLLGLLEAALAAPEAFDERFLLGRATVLRILGRIQEALENLERLLAVPDLTMPTRALAHHEQGRAFSELDEEGRGHEQALDAYGEALAICEGLSTGTGPERGERRRLDGEIAALLQDTAAIHQYVLGRPADLAFARQLYAASASLWERLRDSALRAQSEKQRAEILRTGSADERAEAKRIYRQVMLAFKRKGLERPYSEALLQLGKIYQEEHAFKHALKRFQEYEEIQHHLGLEREEAIAWKQQGEIYQEAGYRGRTVRKAIELYGRALERLQHYQDRRSRRVVVAALLRRGEAYLELRQAEQAAHDFRAAWQGSLALGRRQEQFDPERLSETDRQRLLWAYCATRHAPITPDDGDLGPDAAVAVQAT
jgi:tetratricopeptide (TPR) repeat protein